jgi:hypothetical protein
MSILALRPEWLRTRIAAVRLFPWLAAAIVCLCLLAAFRIGIDRGFRDSIGVAAWGRILFGVGTAITEMDHGGHGYALSTVVETVLTYNGLTGDSDTLARLGAQFPANLRDPTLINAAIDKAARFQWPFNPEEGVRGSGGDDIGFVDYVRLSFLLFGHNIQSLYYTYFLIFAISAAAFLYTFQTRPAHLMMLVIVSVAQIILFSSNLFGVGGLGSIADPRFLSVMAFVPGLHLACLLLDRAPPSLVNVASAILQSAILVFALWIRASAVWVVVAVAFLAGLMVMRGLLARRNELRHIWAFGVLIAVLSAPMLRIAISLHPVYKNEISHHVLWHAVFYELQLHPRWNEKYAATYDFAGGDALPPLAARKYLLRYPPSNPEEVYLTPDHQYLRVAAAETYIQKALFEFFVNDPRFVAESILVYNPVMVALVFRSNLSSLLEIPFMQFIGMLLVFLILAGILATDDEQRRLYRRVALLATVGFFVSPLPIVLTAPNNAVMGDQFLALLVVLGCWTALALASGARMLLGVRAAIGSC